ncbi:MAG: ABC transporter ATP-binding protein [Firmicutes bacterium]|nr:ABC transporter ATP-binding protein [Bacillota bacterium]
MLTNLKRSQEEIGPFPGEPTVTSLAGDELLRIEDLHTYFQTEQGLVKAVNGVSFELRQSQVLGVVGESGCGKSMTALSVMQLLPEPKGKIYAGRILYQREKEGVVDLAQLEPRGPEMRNIRGNEIAMIFQEPMTSLNPVMTIGEQIMEVVELHRRATKKEALEIAVDMIRKVGIPSPEQRVREYPHQLSGGMRQRAMIAMALSCNPRLLIADEPTTALDVTIQAQILDLMQRLQSEYQMAIMMITHNLGVVTKICDEVVVMYLGKVVERGTVRQILKESLHPYTIGLVRSIPVIGPRSERRLTPIRGSVPNPTDALPGCPFQDRCDRRMDQCAEEPPMVEENGHQVRCWLYVA